MKYDYIKEANLVREAYQAGTIDKEQARIKLEAIENKAFEVYPDAEPDGDITYCVASVWGEIID
jgi:hypothetical protein